MTNIEGTLTIQTHVFDANGETVTEDRTTYEHGISSDTVLISGPVFEPDVSEAQTYTIETRLLHEDQEIFAETKRFDVHPEPIPAKVEARQEIEDKTIHPEEDELQVQYEVEGIGRALENTRAPVDLALVLDSSGSMAWGDTDNVRATPSRFDYAIEASKHVVDLLENEDRALVAQFYSYWTYFRQSLTSDKDRLKGALENLRRPYGGTPIGYAMRDTRSRLLKNGDPEHDKIILLMTDGAESYVSDSYLINQARYAANADITVHTIGLGSGADQTILQRIADITGGTYRFSPTMEELEEMMVEIGDQIFNVSGRDVTLRTTLPSYVTLDEQQTSPSPTNVETHDNGEVTVEWTYDVITFEQLESITLALQTKDVDPSTEVVATKDTALTYIDVDGYSHTQSLPDLKVQTTGTLGLGVTTSETTLYPDDELQVDVTIENDTTESKDVTLEVDIVDEEGTSVEALTSEVITIEGHHNIEQAYTWSVGQTYTGQYELVVRAEEADGTFVERVIPITVQGDGTVDLDIHTDQAHYAPGEPVTVTNVLNNTNQNDTYDQIKVQTRWLTEDGEIITAQERDISLSAEDRREVAFTFEETNRAPGTYTLQTEVWIDDTRHTTKDVTVVIEETDQTYVGLAGDLSVAERQYYIGQEAEVTYTLTNNGNTDIEDIPVHLYVLDPNTEQKREEITSTVSLEQGETLEHEALIPTTQLDAGDYLLSLQVQRPDGEWLNLSTTGFILEVGLEADLKVTSETRMLLWTESGEDKLASTFTELGATVKVVRDEEAFLTALRSGAYNVYVLQDSKRPLTAQHDQELLAQLHKGQGLMATEDFNLADFWVYDVFDRPKPSQSGQDKSTHDNHWDPTTYGWGKAAYLNASMLRMADEDDVAFHKEAERVLQHVSPREVNKETGGHTTYAVKLEAKGAALHTKVEISLPEEVQILDSGDFIQQDHTLQWTGTVPVEPQTLTFVTTQPMEKGTYPVTIYPAFENEEEWVTLDPTTISIDVQVGRDALLHHAITALDEAQIKQGQGQINRTLEQLRAEQQSPAQTIQGLDERITSIVKSLELLTKDDGQEETRLRLEQLLAYLQQKRFLEVEVND
nr:VWA domain-containing protein [Caldalkalibacillus salinus]